MTRESAFGSERELEDFSSALATNVDDMAERGTDLDEAKAAFARAWATFTENCSIRISEGGKAHKIMTEQKTFGGTTWEQDRADARTTMTAAILQDDKDKAATALATYMADPSKFEKKTYDKIVDSVTNVGAQILNKIQKCWNSVKAALTAPTNKRKSLIAAAANVAGKAVLSLVHQAYNAIATGLERTAVKFKHSAKLEKAALAAGNALYKAAGQRGLAQTGNVTAQAASKARQEARHAALTEVNINSTRRAESLGIAKKGTADTMAKREIAAKKLQRAFRASKIRKSLTRR